MSDESDRKDADETPDPFKGLNIFEDCARRCPYCRSTAFTGYAGARRIDWLVCMGCGRSLHETELTEPDWKLGTIFQGD